MSMTAENLLGIAREYGTPLYVYDGDKILDAYKKLHKYIPYSKLKIHYAMKANYNFAILKMLQQAGAGIDAVSPGDVIMALKAGFSADKIIYTANNITDAEMQQVKELGVLFNIGSLSRLEKFGKAYPKSEICLRFNPDVVDGAHSKIMTGGDLTKFGILLQDVEAVKAIVAKYQLKVVGLHEHTGSGLQKTESVFASMTNLMRIATPDNFPELRFLDFGGGFKVPYEPNEEAVDYEAMGEEITARFNRFCQDYGRELDLLFEPGKFIVAESGYLLTEVNTIKDNNGRLIGGCNSGFSQLLRPVLYDAYHHITNISNPNGNHKTYDICGNICETGDRFAEQRAMAEISEGDILAIENAGAYCYAMGGSYNLRPMPAEVLAQNGEIKVVRKGLSSAELVDLIIGESQCK